MIDFSNTSRSTQKELMDNLELNGAQMEALLTDLKRVNQLLGGTSITLNGIDRLLKTTDKQEIRIVDIGCGDGELLRKCADFLKKKGRTCTFVGVDANPHILETARARSQKHPEIRYQTLNVLSDEINALTADIFLCTLFLHHFKNKQIIALLNKLVQQSKLGVVVNDLHRSKLAFNLFKLFSAIFIKTPIAKHDGLVSVARGFKKIELIKISEKLRFKTQSITWKWAFRFQWILFK